MGCHRLGNKEQVNFGQAAPPSTYPGAALPSGEEGACRGWAEEGSGLPTLGR